MVETTATTTRTTGTKTQRKLIPRSRLGGRNLADSPTALFTAAAPVKLMAPGELKTTPGEDPGGAGEVRDFTR